MTILHFIPDETKAPRKMYRMSSLVCVIGEEKNYTQSEIDLLEAFARAHLVWSDFIGLDKRKAYYVFFQKLDDNKWHRRKESWANVNCIEPTLEEALASMYRANNIPIPQALIATRRNPPAVVRLTDGIRVTEVPHA
ncbi:MAG: hypothetical protein WC464_08845 [Bdellovibrionales bacterium]